MKTTTIALILALSLTSACAEFSGDIAYPGSINSASSVGSAGELGWLWALLGIVVLFLLVNDDSGSGSGPTNTN